MLNLEPEEFDNKHRRDCSNNAVMKEGASIASPISLCSISTNLAQQNFEAKQQVD